MTEEVIKYGSQQRVTQGLTEVQLETSSKEGLNWEWTYYTDYSSSPISSAPGKVEKCAFLKWKFSWDELKKQGVEGFVGEITTIHKNRQGYENSSRFYVKLTHSGQLIRKRIGTLEETLHGSYRYFTFKFSLKKVLKKPERIFSTPSEVHDAVLVVEGNKISVNKTYLSMRSEFFNTLFNSDFKEKSMEEIPINDVKYEDFRRLLSLIHPTNPSAPTDENAEKLLELADRFIIPAVINKVGYHLFHNSELPFFKLLELADKYKLEDLLERCLFQFTTVEQIGFFNDRTGTFKPSDELSVKLFQRTLAILEK